MLRRCRVPGKFSRRSFKNDRCWSANPCCCLPSNLSVFLIAWHGHENVVSCFCVFLLMTPHRAKYLWTEHLSTAKITLLCSCWVRYLSPAPPPLNGLRRDAGAPDGANDVDCCSFASGTVDIEGCIPDHSMALYGVLSQYAKSDPPTSGLQVCAPWNGIGCARGEGGWGYRLRPWWWTMFPLICLSDRARNRCAGIVCFGSNLRCRPQLLICCLVCIVFDTSFAGVTMALLPAVAVGRLSIPVYLLFRRSQHAQSSRNAVHLLWIAACDRMHIRVVNSVFFSDATIPRQGLLLVGRCGRRRFNLDARSRFRLPPAHTSGNQHANPATPFFLGVTAPPRFNTYHALPLISVHLHLSPGRRVRRE